MSTTKGKRFPRRPPRRPDPNITPTTMKGNYPKRDAVPPPLRQNPGWSSSSVEGKRETRQPSNTPYTKSSPRPRPPRPHQKPGDTSGVALAPIEWGVPNWLLRFIDWMNDKLGATKKKKRSGEQMATLEDLFDEVEDNEPIDDLPGWAHIMKLQVRQMMDQKQRELEERMAQPGYSEWVAEENRKYIERNKR